MRKHFLLFLAAFCSVVAVNAETITLEPGEDKIADAIASAEAGDVIELTGDAENEYTEWNTITLDKAITLKAAEGATPVVHMPKIKTNAEFTAEGIEFYGFTDYLFRTEVGGDFSLTFRNCEIHDNPAYVIYISSGQSINALTIDGCIFHDNTKDENAVVNGSGTIGTFTFTNNTVYNIPGKYAVRVKGLTSAVVDHCTFYNCGKTPLAFGETAATNISVSNTTFSNPALVDGDAMIFYNYGAIDNCVYFNTSGCANWMATQTNTINANPLFADPANGDFNFSIFSPLCFAATDGKHIGDPRWEAQSGAGIDFPTDATPVVLDKGNVGAVSADMTYYGDDAYFDFGPNDSPKDTLRWVKWLVNVNKRAYSVSAELTSANGYKLVLDVIDPSTGAVVLTSDTAKTPSFNTIDFSGLEEKSYILRLKNRQDWSKVKVKSVTFTYAGGAVVEVPGTLQATDAILTSGAIIKEDGYIYYSSTSVDNARWNIHVSAAIGAKVSMDVKEASGHHFYVYVYDTNNQLIATAKEKLWNEWEGAQDLGNVSFPAAGNYYVVVADSSGGSQATFKNLTFTYAGGNVVEVPSTDALPLTDAILSANASVNNDGYVVFGNRANDFVRWNIHTSGAVGAKVTMDVAATNGHTYVVSVYNMNGEQVATAKEKEWTDASGIMDLGTIAFPAEGNYYIKVTNTESGSTATFKNLTLTAAGGEVVDAGLLPNEEVVLVGAVNRNANGNIQSSGKETVPTDEYFYWNVNFPKEGYYDISLNVAAKNEQGTSSGHIYKVFIDEEEQACTQEGYSELAGDCELTESAVLISTAGVHKIKIVNAQKWSSAMLHSVTLTYVGLIITDTDEDIDFTAYKDQTVGLRLQRTFKANMWNPICLPFAVSHEQLVSILKAEDAYYLKDASLENQKLSIYLQKDNGIYQGVPYFFKPSENVENPVFEDVTIAQPDPQATNKGVIRLQGTYASHELDNPSHVLLVGANNTLFFPSDDTPYIKSMRAYFILKDVEPSQMPRFAAFVEPGNAPTEMIIVGGEAERQKGHRKVLVDGQIRIQHEGKCYSILGLER